MKVKITALTEVEEIIEIDDKFQGGVIDNEKWHDLTEEEQDRVWGLGEEAADLAYEHFRKKYGNSVNRHSVCVYTEDYQAIYEE